MSPILFIVGCYTLLFVSSYLTASFSSSQTKKISLNMEESPDPPFQETFKTLINSLNDPPKSCGHDFFIVENCQLPLIDLNKLKEGDIESENCKMKIAKASREWGFFQVVNHGISRDLLEKMRLQQMNLFKKPFSQKVIDDQKNDHFLACSYRWGMPATATCLEQLSWSEAFHVPLNAISGLGGSDDVLSSTMAKFAKPVTELAHKLAEILAEKLGHESTFFKETCLPSTCYLRMNRYPPCPISPQLFGLMPHTDSDFITILHQDQIGGLQLVKDGKWFAVKPKPEALIINIGDLFQAWSNGIYKSVEHRVVTNMLKERFSIAFFMCPSYETKLKSCKEPSVYKTFTFKEYRDQVQDDVKKYGRKIGLSRFLL